MGYFIIGFILGVFIGAFAISKRFRRKFMNAIRQFGHNEEDDLYYYNEDDE